MHNKSGTLCPFSAAPPSPSLLSRSTISLRYHHRRLLLTPALNLCWGWVAREDTRGIWHHDPNIPVQVEWWASVLFLAKIEFSMNFGCASLTRKGLKLCHHKVVENVAADPCPKGDAIVRSDRILAMPKLQRMRLHCHSGSLWCLLNKVSIPS